MDPIKLISGSEELTEQIGFKLGRLIHKGCTVCLYGELGAGKTTLIKGIASAFGIPSRDLGSASFVIVAEYKTSPPFYHIDLYRIEGEEALDDIGLWEYFGPEGVAVVEWAERLAELPEGALKVSINCLDGDTREILIEGIDEADWNNN